jgi:ribonuclease T2
MEMRLRSVLKGVCVVLLAGLFTVGKGVRAEVPLDGSFVAGENCSAFQSIKKQSNPVKLEVGHPYQIVAANKEAASHFLIVVPGANPERRWAPIGCGKREGGQPMDQGATTAPQTNSNSSQPNDATKQSNKQNGQQRTQYVLAASWEPAFCETKPDKVECQTQTADRFDSSHLALHGLWPQPRSVGYCRVEQPQIEDDKAGRWTELPAVTLEPATVEELNKVMPGTQSHLERHEWTRHGTCYGTSADEYFADALALMRALNGSAVQQLFASHTGQFLSFDDISKAFDQSFGEGAGRRVRMQCARDNGRLIISELTIGLTGNITPQSSLAELIAAAQPTKTECPGGIVDVPGQQ